MKSWLLFFVFVLGWPFRTVAQDAAPANEPVYEMKDADTEPFFYAGSDALYEFIAQHFQKPKVPGLVGKVFVSFIVEMDGSITDVFSSKDIGFGTGAEAERVMKLSPKWVPGRKDGKVVRVRYYLPIPVHTE